MEMVLCRLQGPQGEVLVLDSGRRPPRLLEQQLLLCRSITLGADRILVGPLAMPPPLRVWVLDPEGRQVPLESWTARAFSVFAQSHGYGALPLQVTDGTECFTIQRQERLWQEIPTPALETLLSL